MSDTNIYLRFLDQEISDTGTYTNGGVLICAQHGDLKYYPYDGYVPADEVLADIEEHRRTMHFG